MSSGNARDDRKIIQKLRRTLQELRIDLSRQNRKAELVMNATGLVPKKIDGLSRPGLRNPNHKPTRPNR
jgi:hypothetical protein